mgnify:FL=1
MPLHLVSPFDREVETPPGDNPPGPISTQHWRQPLRDICFILIKAGAYLGSIYLAVLGLPLLFFLLLAGGDLGLFFMHLGNLAAHYLAADHAAQAGFINELKLGLFGVATLVVIWRLPRFLDDVSAALAPRKEVL